MKQRLKSCNFNRVLENSRLHKSVICINAKIYVLAFRIYFVIFAKNVPRSFVVDNRAVCREIQFNVLSKSPSFRINSNILQPTFSVKIQRQQNDFVNLSRARATKKRLGLYFEQSIQSIHETRTIHAYAHSNGAGAVNRSCIISVCGPGVHTRVAGTRQGKHDLSNQIRSRIRQDLAATLARLLMLLRRAWQHCLQRVSGTSGNTNADRQVRPSRSYLFAQVYPHSGSNACTRVQRRRRSTFLRVFEQNFCQRILTTFLSRSSTDSPRIASEV